MQLHISDLKVIFCEKKLIRYKVELIKFQKINNIIDLTITNRVFLETMTLQEDKLLNSKIKHDSLIIELKHMKERLKRINLIW